MSSLCVITPTIGRPTLWDALQSARLMPGDEWLVVGDGPQPEAKQIINNLCISGLTYLRYFETEPTGNYGNSQRDAAMAQATADYLVFLDDDDIFAPGAVDTIRHIVDQGAPRPHIFRMQNSTGVTIWEKPIFDRGNVGGSMLVVPNVPNKLARWGNGEGYDTDFRFIQKTLESWEPTQIVWSGELIVICKPERQK